MSKPARGGPDRSNIRPPGQRVIGTADEMLEVIEQVQRAPAAFNAFASSGNAALFWESYQLSRAGGAKPPERILQVLDSVVQDLLAATTDAEVARAVGLSRPKAGPGKPALAAEVLKSYELCSDVWLTATGGRFEPGDEPPDPVPSGVHAIVALRHFGAAGKTERDRVRKTWSRWNKRLDQAVMVQVMAHALARR